MTHVAFFGHKPERLGMSMELVMHGTKKWFEEHPEVTDCLIGGNRGAQTYAGYAAWHFGRKLHLYLPYPFEIFTKGWKSFSSEKGRLEKLIKASSSLHVHRKDFDRDAEDELNDLMLETSHEAFFVYDGEKYGKTYRVLERARDRGIKIWIMHPHTCAIRREE